jgi:hypothetical protein
VADIRRLETGVGQFEEGDIAWLQEYARFRDQAQDAPEVQVRVGQWHFLVVQVTGTVRPADQAAARALRGTGTRKMDRAVVELALSFSHTQPAIGWLWLHADGRPTRRNPAFPPCWRVVRPKNSGTWIGWPACAHVDYFCPDANRHRSDRRVRS